MAEVVHASSPCNGNLAAKRAGPRGAGSSSDATQRLTGSSSGLVVSSRTVSGTRSARARGRPDDPGPPPSGSAGTAIDAGPIVTGPITRSRAKSRSKSRVPIPKAISVAGKAKLALKGQISATRKECHSISTMDGHAQSLSVSIAQAGPATSSGESSSPVVDSTPLSANDRLRLVLRPLSSDSLDLPLLRECLEPVEHTLALSTDSAFVSILGGDPVASMELLDLHFQVLPASDQDAEAFGQESFCTSASTMECVDPPSETTGPTEHLNSAVLSLLDPSVEEESWHTVTTKKHRATNSTSTSVSGAQLHCGPSISPPASPLEPQVHTVDKIRPKTIILYPILEKTTEEHVQLLRRTIEDNTNVRRFRVDHGSNGDILLTFVTAGGCTHALVVIRRLLSADYSIVTQSTTPSLLVRDPANRVGPPGPPSKAPSKMLICRVSNAPTPQDAVKLLQGCLDSKTNLLNYNIQLLIRGDLKISFRSPSSVEIARQALSSCPDIRIIDRSDSQAHSSWLLRKELWEIIVCEVPPFINIEDLKSFTGASRCSRRRRDVLLSFANKAQAACFLSSGIFFENIYFRTRPWVALPKEFIVENSKCSRCLQADHVTSDCPSTSASCQSCRGAHMTHLCPNAVAARGRKLKSYAQALGGSSDVAPRQGSTYLKPNRVDDKESLVSFPLLSRPHTSASSITSSTPVSSNTIEELRELIKEQAILIASLQQQVQALSAGSPVSTSSASSSISRGTLSSICALCSSSTPFFPHQQNGLLDHSDSKQAIAHDYHLTSVSDESSEPSKAPYVRRTRNSSSRTSAYGSAIAKFKADASRMDIDASSPEREGIGADVSANDHSILLNEDLDGSNIDDRHLMEIGPPDDHANAQLMTAMELDPESADTLAHSDDAMSRLDS